MFSVTHQRVDGVELLNDIGCPTGPILLCDFATNNIYVEQNDSIPAIFSNLQTKHQSTDYSTVQNANVINSDVVEIFSQKSLDLERTRRKY